MQKWGHTSSSSKLLHKLKFIAYPLNNINTWMTLCGLEYNEYPQPYFTAKGMKCKKCQKTMKLRLEINKGY